MISVFLKAYHITVRECVWRPLSDVMAALQQRSANHPSGASSLTIDYLQRQGLLVQQQTSSSPDFIGVELPLSRHPSLM